MEYLQAFISLVKLRGLSQPAVRTAATKMSWTKKGPQSCLAEKDRDIPNLFRSSAETKKTWDYELENIMTLKNLFLKTNLQTCVLIFLTEDHLDYEH